MVLSTTKNPDFALVLSLAGSGKRLPGPISHLGKCRVELHVVAEINREEKLPDQNRQTHL